ncbi:MAG: dockerin type I domain-containing protein [Planctomycetota bacterium]|nr:dockerin type I domain-containing protein [Planctomycetota bacterium]
MLTGIVIRRASRTTHLLALASYAAALAAGVSSGVAEEPVWDVGPGQPGMNDRINVLYAGDEASPTGSALIAGGMFTSAGGADIADIALWDGSAWQPLGEDQSFGDVFSISPFQGDLYIAALLGPPPSLWRWNGESWTPINDAPNSWLSALAVYDAGDGPELYVSGGFVFEASDGWTDYIVRWDGTTWYTAGDLASAAYQMLVWDDGGGPDLYGAGIMGVMLEGGGTCNGIARWDGSEWSPLGGCLNHIGNALAVFDDGAGEALYVGGNFTIAGHVSARHVAKWDGADWSPLADGVNGEVFALAVFDDGSGPALYVGGEFSEAGGVEAQNIARWDGLSWSALGEGANDIVRALAPIGEEAGGPALAVAGDFTMIGGQLANRIAFLRPASSDMPGDVDGDGEVDTSDLLLLLAAWGDCPDPPADCPADFNADDRVDTADLLILLANWAG